MQKVPEETGQIPAPAQVLQLLIGKWISQAITTAAKLNLADHLADGAMGLPELAERSGTTPRGLLGLLRALASVGIFREEEGLRFTNTELSETLRTSVPYSTRALALFLGDKPTWHAWGELGYALRTGKSAFQHVNGALPYDYFAKRGEECAYYDEAFTNFSNQEMGAVLSVMPFSEVATLVDIGGGHGTMLCSALRQNPKQRGILFDQPHVVEGAPPVIASFGVSSRCSVVGGDFFEKVPEGGDGYIIKHVLFNWDDERARKILKTIRRSVSSHSRIFVIDPVIRPGAGQVFAKFMDLEMMVLHEGGCQRTAAEFTDLLASAGFKVTRIVDTQAPSSIIEAVPV